MFLKCQETIIWRIKLFISSWTPSLVILTFELWHSRKKKQKKRGQYSFKLGDMGMWYTGVVENRLFHIKWGCVRYFGQLVTVPSGYLEKYNICICLSFWELFVLKLCQILFLLNSLDNDKKKIKIKKKYLGQKCSWGWQKYNKKGGKWPKM